MLSSPHISTCWRASTALSALIQPAPPCASHSARVFSYRPHPSLPCSYTATIPDPYPFAPSDDLESHPSALSGGLMLTLRRTPSGQTALVPTSPPQAPRLHPRTSTPLPYRPHPRNRPPARFRHTTFCPPPPASGQFWCVPDLPPIAPAHFPQHPAFRPNPPNTKLALERRPQPYLRRARQ